MVGGEIGSVKSGHGTDDLLGRKAPIPDHDEVTADRFGIEVTNRAGDVRVA